MEATAAVEGKKAAAFNKLDFMALVLSKHLHTKAFLISYVQGHGSPGAQVFTSKNQRRVMEYIEDAQEWEDASATAVSERLSDWEILQSCRRTMLPRPWPVRICCRSRGDLPAQCRFVVAA